VGSFRGFSLTGQAARGFRDPTLSDRYFRGPTGRGFITGNPDLEPETSLQYDVALRYAAPRFRAAAFYYHYDIHDLIERYQTQTDFFFFRNSGEARVEGFELESQADLGRQFTLELAFQVSDGILTATGAHLDGIAPVTFSTQLRRQFGQRAFVQIRTAFYSDDEEPGPTERIVNGYTMLDLSGGYDVARPLELRVIARNLLNEEYFASQDTRTVLAPGRSVAVVAAVKF
jgi:outer membrane receptor protein involved in Fe transport